MFPLPLKRLRCLLVFVFATATQATILPSPTVTNASPGFQGIYVGSNAVGQGLSEFLSEQGTSTFLEFDFGSARTVDGFVNVTLVLAERSIGANRLIFDTDGTTGFNAATDTVVSFTQAQTGSQGQGYIQRFKAVTAQKVRWEVQALVGSPSLVGTTEMSFLSTQGATVPITGVTVIGSATPFSSQYAAANAANGIAGIGNVAGVEYASLGLGAGAYVDFDLGSARAITGFDMFDRLFDAERATSFDLIFSNNADMSSPVATRSYSKASSWTASDNFAAPITARYVRYDITAGSGNTGLSDIQFYASEFPGANLGVVVSGTPREVTFAVSGKTGVVSDVTLEWTFNPAQGQAHEAYVELFAPDNTLCDVFRSHVVDDTDIAGPYVFNDAHTALISNAVVSTAGGSVAAGNYRPEYQNVARSFRTTFGGKNPNGVWKLRVQDILSSGFAPTISSANLSIRTAPAPRPHRRVSPVWHQRSACSQVET
jgi:F5/8 type C domain